MMVLRRLRRLRRILANPTNTRVMGRLFQNASQPSQASQIAFPRSPQTAISPCMSPGGTPRRLPVLRRRHSQGIHS